MALDLDIDGADNHPTPIAGPRRPTGLLLALTEPNTNLGFLCRVQSPADRQHPNHVARVA